MATFVQSLLSQASEYVKTNASSLSQKVRLQLKDAAWDLYHTLETPDEAFYRCFEEGWRVGCIRTSMQAGWTSALVKSGKPMTITELGTATNTDPKLARRILRGLATFKVVNETAVDTFQANEKTSRFLPETGWAMAAFTRSTLIPETMELANHLKKLNWREPANTDESVHATVKGHSFWVESQKNDTIRSEFNQLMVEISRNRQNWPDIYPCKDRLVRTATPPEILLVDIAGGVGHDVRYLASKNLGLPGKVIVQDLESTFETLNDEQKKEINASVYDFFTPQPVKGAANYVFHHILHDWSDSQALDILKNTVPALDKDSRILIVDHCLPATGARWQHIVEDMDMLGNLGGKERTLPEWEELVTQAGAKIIEVFHPDDSGESVIEVGLP